MFVSREQCLSCGSSNLKEIAGGRFGDEPLRSFIDGDPWGENPLPLLENERWSFVECTACALRFHRRILAPEWNEVRFSKWMSEDAIRQFEASYGAAPNAAGQHVQHALRLKSLGVERVLDFGCGFGQFLEMCHLFGLDAVGVDRSNARRSGATFAIYAELEEAPGTFDAISMFEVLEHLDDPLTILGSLKKRLRPNGLLIVEVPDTSGVDAIDSRNSYYKIHPLDHINAFTPDSLVKILAKAGFSPVRKGPAFVTTSLERVVKDLAKSALKQKSTQRYFRATS